MTQQKSLPMNPLLKVENRAVLMQKIMINIDTLQNKMIEEANNQITNLAEFEKAASQRFQALRVKLSSSMYRLTKDC